MLIPTANQCRYKYTINFAAINAPTSTAADVANHLFYEWPELDGWNSRDIAAVDAVQHALRQRKCEVADSTAHGSIVLAPISPAASTSPPGTQPVILITFNSLSLLKRKLHLHATNKAATPSTRMFQAPLHTQITSSPHQALLTHFRVRVLENAE